MATSVYVGKNNGIATYACVTKNCGIVPSSCASTDTGIVLVTGASGFIASQIVDLLMRNGHRVRGTVRSLTNGLKVRPLLNLCPDAKYALELIEADLNDHDSWDRAVQGCRYVLHVASPFPAVAPEHEDDLIRPAVNGTLSVLQASHKHRVKRVVLTSSFSAIFDDLGDRDPLCKVFTEDDWTDAETAKDAYIKSKTLAERAAWNFVAQLPECERFELAVLNPTNVFGPLLCGVPGTSPLIVRKVLTREIPVIPRFNFPAVDVRDVALAHMRAMTLPQAAWRRTIVHSGCNLWLKDMSTILYNEFKPQGYSIPTQIGPYWFLRIAMLFIKTLKRALPMYGKLLEIDCTKTTSILGITPRDVRQSIVDMAYSQIERGFVRKTRRYHGRPTYIN